MVRMFVDAVMSLNAMNHSNLLVASLSCKLIQYRGRGKKLGAEYSFSRVLSGCPGRNKFPSKFTTLAAR